MPFGVKKPGIKLFNIDLHMSVVADVKDTLARLYGDRVAVTHWYIGLMQVEAFGFPKPSLNMAELFQKEQAEAWRFGIEGDPTTLNEFSWQHIDQEMIDKFVERYKAELAKYDGFVVTHTPVFARLYESFGKPVILINSCRYDQPFCFHGQENERAALHTCLKNLQDKGLLIAISNNRADQEYMRLGAGIDSVRIPSLCLYTHVTVDPQRAKGKNALVVCKRTVAIPPAQQEALQRAGLLEDVKPKDSANAVASWDELFHRRALIHFPYEMSTMSLFEQYSAGAVLLFPSRRFCQELVTRRGSCANDVVSLGIGCMYWKNGGYRRTLWPASYEDLPPPFHTMISKFPDTHEVVRDGDGKWVFSVGNAARQVPAELACTLDVEWWLDRADFYDSEWFPGIRYFDSWEEMLEMAQQEPADEERYDMAQQVASRNEKIMHMWRGLLEPKFPQLSK